MMTVELNSTGTSLGPRVAKPTAVGPAERLKQCPYHSAHQSLDSEGADWRRVVEQPNCWIDS